MDAEDKHAADARVVYLRRCVCNSLKCKDDKVDRLLVHEDSAAAVTAFLDSNELNRLLVYDAGKGELAAVRFGARRQDGLASEQPSLTSLLRPHARLWRLLRASPDAQPDCAARRRKHGARKPLRVRCGACGVLSPKTPLLSPHRAPCPPPS